MSRLCALVIGHKKYSSGAVNEKHGITEFDFNESLAMQIEKVGTDTQVQRIYRRTYKLLPEDINLLDPDFIVSLHCNAYNKRVSGTEVLFYHKSDMGKNVAEILQTNLVEHLGLSNRGIKPKTTEDRGGYLLRYTDAPCVIAEPFFIDNNRDFELVQADLDVLSETYAASIDEIAQIIPEETSPEDQILL